MSKFTLILMFAATLAMGQNPTSREYSCTSASAAGTDTYACSLLVAPANYAAIQGKPVRFQADVVNTGAATLNLNSLGAIAIKKVAGGVTTALDDNDIRANQFVTLIYDGTNFQMQSQLGNAASGGSGYATVQDEGSGLTQRATINFIGSGVSCADNSGSSKTDCTISGSGGSAPSSLAWFPWGYYPNYTAGGAAVAGASHAGTAQMFTVLGTPIAFDKIVFEITTASGTSCTGGTCGLVAGIYASDLASSVCVSTVGTSVNCTADLNINATGIKALTMASGSGVSGGVCTLQPGTYELVLSTDSTALALTYNAAGGATAVSSNGMLQHKATGRSGASSSSVSSSNGASLALTADLSSITWSATWVMQVMLEK